MLLNMFWEIDDTMSQTQRITHIDSLRGAAVLLMVMVHAAATWNPFQNPQLSVLAYVVSGLGGLAAPLFVTLFGWGIIRSQLSMKQRTFQAMFLFTAQVLVNLTSPHLFNPLTPGILSLMGLVTLLSPSFTHLIKTYGMRPLYIAIILIFTLQNLFPELQGVGQWSDRVNDETFFLIISNLFFTGTYPLFPWIVFVLLGATISSQDSSSGITLPTTSLTKAALGFGLLFCSSTFLYSQYSGELWAHPTADAYLTFFPANSAFIIAAFTGVLLIWYLIQSYEFQFLNSTGKISLTIYLIHFIPLSIMHQYEETYQWGLSFSSIAVLFYTFSWIPISILWVKYLPQVNFETILRGIRKSL